MQATATGDFAAPSPAVARTLGDGWRWQGGYWLPRRGWAWSAAGGGTAGGWAAGPDTAARPVASRSPSHGRHLTPAGEAAGCPGPGPEAAGPPRPDPAGCTAGHKPADPGSAAGATGSQAERVTRGRRARPVAPRKRSQPQRTLPSYPLTCRLWAPAAEFRFKQNLAVKGAPQTIYICSRPARWPSVCPDSTPPAQRHAAPHVCVTDTVTRKDGSTYTHFVHMHRPASRSDTASSPHSDICFPVHTQTF